ncbi:mannose-1-phosphate guanylyltransferase [Paenibacillus sp. V4I9]|uniref:sugar phosphate nucleotidyltransferase n=1 Tax=Paenibacillus sp. V4I9 TaxID=3042308 RepID=UPI002784CF1A|nr:sugar phosphate nucleotidyltransferase [Paenibacillus sp. V4I9]MDQ0890862.1 mannose-1-phosphate guanylyltransferase [Paenibacillus sp. V4I9]
MKLVLLSGGSGKRLWPLSNDSRSKQFLKVLDNPNGDLESMVQRVWRQLQGLKLSDSAFVATGRSQVDILQNQLGSEVRMVVEPERRDTFPAIALAATYLYSIEGVSLNEVITIVPVDPFVEASFFEEVTKLEQTLHESGADIALMGVKPALASEKYGYIVPDQSEETASEQTFRRVSHFREKPAQSDAVALIQQGALWNCGVFAFKLDYLINLLLEKGLPIHYEETLKQYSKLPKISFDYEVIEKAEHVIVSRYNGDWKDLGTWNTLTEELTKPVMGKGIMTDDSVNTHIVNELDMPVTVLGLSNVVVAVSPDGILVTDKAASPRIKEVMKSVDYRTMYEERRWGRYQVVDYSKYGEGNEVLTKRICVKAGKNLSYHLHEKRSEVWTVIAGQGQLILNEKSFVLGAGDVLKIPEGMRHGLRAVTDLELIEVQIGSDLFEEDIIRLSADWNEIEKLEIQSM